MISSFFIENSKGPLNFNTNPDAHFEARILQSARTRLQSRVTSLLVIINFLAIIARREKSFSELDKLTISPSQYEHIVQGRLQGDPDQVRFYHALYNLLTLSNEMVMRMRERFKWTMGSYLSQVSAISNDPKNFIIWNWETQLSYSHHLSHRGKFPLVLMIYKVSWWPFHLWLFVTRFISSTNAFIYLKKKT